MYNSLVCRSMFRRAGAWTSKFCGSFCVSASRVAMRTIADSKVENKAAIKLLKTDIKVEKIAKPVKKNLTKDINNKISNKNNKTKRRYIRKNKNKSNNSNTVSDRKSNKKAVRADKAKDNEPKLNAKSRIKAATTASLLNTIMKDGLKVEGDEDLSKVSARPAYMSVEREEEVLKKAERMQLRDLTGEVPVPAFTFEILKAHPSLLNMGLRERMDFLLIRWSALSNKKRLEYLNDPLRGLM